ncbi:M10 family metallopeptidase C-terminal domain-containing protein [Rhizobium sp. LjRoot254]|uniref:M10 family metallopeptidase C-terminal domain-containing protein n=1 Tax=Rhizobium sp. LjRoot254 TaxID=3342297 RepID=UPI003ECE91B2
MKTVSISKNRTTMFEAKQGDTTYVLERNVSISTADPAGIVGITDVKGRDFLIKGDISAGQGFGIFIGTQDETGAGVLEVAKSGSIYGKVGVKLAADGQVLRNAGLIGGETAVETSGTRMLIQNSGIINGGDTGIDVSFEGGRIVNTGQIFGQDHAITSLLGAGEQLKIVNRGDIGATMETTIILSNLTGSTTTLVNHGNIDGKFWALQANFSLATEIIRNRGEISSQVWLGGGDDIFDDRGGTAYYVDGGEQDDLYIIDDALIVLGEQTNAGTDTVRSTVTWTLGNNFENLIFTGESSLTGKGNDSANRITGNAGQNTLYGYGGIDVINGGRGNDLLYGGALADTFVFTTRSGHDIIADFQNGTDVIDLTRYRELDDFADISAGMVQNGANVEIHLGKTDVLTVNNATIATLTGEDFAY